MTVSSPVMDLTKVASPPDRRDVLPAEPTDSLAVTPEGELDKNAALKELVLVAATMLVTDYECS